MFVSSQLPKRTAHNQTKHRLHWEEQIIKTNVFQLQTRTTKTNKTPLKMKCNYIMCIFDFSHTYIYTAAWTTNEVNWLCERSVFQQKNVAAMLFCSFSVITVGLPEEWLKMPPTNISERNDYWSFFWISPPEYVCVALGRCVGVGWELGGGRGVQIYRLWYLGFQRES